MSWSREPARRGTRIARILAGEGHALAAVLRAFPLAALLFASGSAAAEPGAARPVAVRTRLSIGGEAAHDHFGAAAAAVGDFNGDGFTDFVVGAHLNDAAGERAGRAYLFFGGPAMDDRADLVLTGERPGDLFGFAVAGAGDVDRDGYSDLLVGAPGSAAGGLDAGRAYLFRGGPSADAIPDLILTGDAMGGQFGRAIAGLGDVNDDGYGDFLVAAPFRDVAGATQVGRASLYLGSALPDATADLVFDGSGEFDFLGHSVAGLGDVSGDGHPDFIIGSSGLDSPSPHGYLGTAEVRFGGPGFDEVVDLELHCAGGLGTYLDVAAAGDLSGDGIGDIGVRDRTAGYGGAVRVYFGGVPNDSLPDVDLGLRWGLYQFGQAMVPAGDVDGDGCQDLLLGAPWHDWWIPVGMAYVLYGDPVAITRLDTLDVGLAGEWYGSSVAGLGDQSRDGFDDVLVGGWGDDGAGADAGRVWIYDFNRYHVERPDGGERWAVGTQQAIRWRGAEPADLWISTDGGATWSTLALDVGGAQDNAWTWTVAGPPTESARVRITPHDPAVSGRDSSEQAFAIEVLPVRLGVPHPNPSEDGSITLPFTLDRHADVWFAAYDLAGRLAARRPAEGFGPGPHAVRWRVPADAPGLYWIRMETSRGDVASRRLVVIGK